MKRPDSLSPPFVSCGNSIADREIGELHAYIQHLEKALWEISGNKDAEGKPTWAAKVAKEALDD